jgi:3'-phosphoadenosine 5'-phosphosulfate sulfotransferase (PAPS reductase)/FAD synthetase
MRQLTLLEHRREVELTVLSFGGGQDSTAILYRLGEDAAFRSQWAPGRLLVLMADTGDEHPETYENVRRMQAYCSAKGIEFHFITNDLGYHSENWATLRTQYEVNKSVGSKAYPKTCTWNLKLSPLYKFLEDWVGRTYGVTAGRKEGFRAFVRRHGRIRVILGIAAGEESRVGSDRSGEPKWMQDCFDKAYPLIELKWGRAECQAYIRQLGAVVPPPSNCILCPFMSEQELLHLYLRRPQDYQAWVRFEARKVEEHRRRGVPDERNFGVWGRKLLPQKLAEAQAKYGHMTLAELDEYKMSHGHCVKSRY